VQDYNKLQNTTPQKVYLLAGNGSQIFKTTFRSLCK